MNIRLRYYIFYLFLLEFIISKILVITKVYYRDEDFKKYKIERILKRKDWKYLIK